MKAIEIRDAIVEFVHEHNERFNAPYGVIYNEGVDKKNRKIQRVVFGIARYLDCEINVYSKSFIHVRSSRHGNRVYKKLDEFWTFMREEL